VPTVVTYKLDLMFALLARYLFRIRLPFYTLVNIACGKEVFPEYIHKQLSSEKIFQALEKMLAHPEQCQKECSRLREVLTTQDASANAAKTIQKLIS
jgi:lipid-A-disaccharide synthase